MRRIIYILILLIPNIIFAQYNYLIVNKIEISGNKVTKSKIILRELLFKTGDTVKLSDLDSLTVLNKENVFNTGLFNFVKVSNKIEENRLNVNIDLVERWYIWPIPILEHADRNLSSFLHNKDWSRINYGMFLAIENFRGRKESLKFKARIGYKEQYGFAYQKPGLDKTQKHGIGIESSYFRQKELPVKTENNQLGYYHDFESDYSKHNYRITLRYRYRSNIYNYNNFYVQYNDINISDSVAVANPNYLGQSRTELKYINVEYNYTLDKRDIRYYPLQGFYLNATINNKGLFFKETDITEISANFRWYQSLIKKLYFSQSIKGEYANNYKQEYILIEALGYADNIRAYEYYVIDGNSFFLLKNNLKFEILPNKIYNYPIIPWSQFKKSFLAIYLNAFFDLGYVDNKYSNKTNNMANSWQYGYGVGIDFVTYYDMVFRIDFSSTRYNQTGVYLHMSAAF